MSALAPAIRIPLTKVSPLRRVWTWLASVKLGLTQDEIRHSPSLEEANVPSHELTPRFVIL